VRSCIPISWFFREFGVDRGTEATYWQGSLNVAAIAIDVSSHKGFSEFLFRQKAKDFG
jgi:hypothetical protein